MAKISMIAAIGRNRELGEGDKLIWRIPGDLKRFREITAGHPVVMGRKTFESIGRLLPNRTNIIITRNSDYKVEGAVVVNSIEEGIEHAKKVSGSDEIFIIGGAQIYSLGIKFADKLYLTKIDAEHPTADAFFPNYSEFKKVVFQEKKEEEGLKYEFIDLER